MHLIKSRKDLHEAPEIREPNAELIHSQPEDYVAALRAELPANAVVTEVRQIDYLNYDNDHCSALLVVLDTGHHHLVLNELGPDPLGETTAAGKALAKALKAKFTEGAPAHWTTPRKAHFIARIFGYAC